MRHEFNVTFQRRGCEAQVIVRPSQMVGDGEDPDVYIANLTPSVTQASAGIIVDELNRQLAGTVEDLRHKAYQKGFRDGAAMPGDGPKE